MTKRSTNKQLDQPHFKNPTLDSSEGFNTYVVLTTNQQIIKVHKCCIQVWQWFCTGHIQISLVSLSVSQMPRISAKPLANMAMVKMVWNWASMVGVKCAHSGSRPNSWGPYLKSCVTRTFHRTQGRGVQVRLDLGVAASTMGTIDLELRLRTTSQVPSSTSWQLYIERTQDDTGLYGSVEEWEGKDKKITGSKGNMKENKDGVKRKWKRNVRQITGN